MCTDRPALALAAAVLGVLCMFPAGAGAKPNPHATLDCGYCHAEIPRFGVDTLETVTFWRAEGDEPKLCLRCHGAEANIHPLGVVPAPERLGTRTPEHLPLGKSAAVRGTVVCVTCHFVHAADADWALLRGFPGSDKPDQFVKWQDLCRECHGAGLEKRSPHAGDDRSCAFCHAVKPQPGQSAAVMPVGRRLCEFCHGYKNESHYAGVNPFKEQRDCTGCHDPHLDKSHPARLKAGYFDTIRDSVSLNPHRKRTLCFACHAEGKPGALREASVTALCQRCHDSGVIPGMSHPLNKVPVGYRIPAGWPLAGGALNCVTCHAPGHVPGAVPGRPAETAGTQHLLRGGAPGSRNAVCFLCHDRNQWAGRNPHREAANTLKGCTLCHVTPPVPGRDRAEAVNFVADVNIICLACHDDVDHPGAARHTVTLTPGMPTVPAVLPLGKGRRITCVTCHTPHVDPPAGPHLRMTQEPSAFCRSCHKL